MTTPLLRGSAVRPALTLVLLWTHAHAQGQPGADAAEQGRALLGPFAVVAALVAVLIVALAAYYGLQRRFGADPAVRTRLRLVFLAVTAFVVLAVVAFTTEEVTIVGLVGVVLSAAIAISSTTFITNAMAGIMLRNMRSFEVGDAIVIGDHLGRVSERRLFHVEIQTEDRDLVTLPNLYFLNHPVKVLRSSGTIISAEVSLGYDTPRTLVETLLLEAAAKTALDKPFVQIVALGDFAVTYRVAGLLSDTTTFLSTRSDLRGAMLDALHGGGVEIVSPTFMNTRALAEGARVIPRVAPEPRAGEPPKSERVEEVAFDKASHAEAVAKVRAALEEKRAEVRELEERAGATEEGASGGASRRRLEGLKREAAGLDLELERLEAAAEE